MNKTYITTIILSLELNLSTLSTKTKDILCGYNKIICMVTLMVSYLSHNCDHLGKIDHLRVSIENHFLPVHESYIHVLSRNTKYLTIDDQVCFYRQPFANAVES